MKLQKITGIILGIENIGEFDRKISVFSENSGRLIVRAKGVRKITSRRSFHIDLMNLVQMEIETNGNGILYLREISSLETFFLLKHDPARFAAACLLLSFIEKTLPTGASQKPLFQILKRSLHLLDLGGEPREIFLAFLLRSLRYLGHVPAKISKRELKNHLDHEFILQARRTFGMFSKFESTRSS